MPPVESPAEFTAIGSQPLFCGVSEKVLDAARARQSRWVNKRRLNWYLADRLPGLSLEAQTAAYAASFANWQRVCGLTFTQTPDRAQADFVWMVRKIDRGGGVLAEHELPPGNDQPLRGWFDSADSWANASPPPQGRIDLVAVATHELGHGLGLSHTNVPGSLLNPYYDPRIRTPQAWDIQQAVDRYGPPVEEPKPPTEPPITPPGTPGGPPAKFSGMIEIPAGLPAGIYKINLVQQL